MLSSNQAELLRRIIDAGRPVTLAEASDWQVSGPYAFGENAARNALKRMEQRELVVGSGVGRSRNYSATRIGTSTLTEHVGATPPAEDAGPVSATRNYIVLEQVAVGDMDDTELTALLDDVDYLYVHVGTVDARNTEHALRQAANDAYDDVDAEPTLIPVAERMWQPEKVTIRNQRTVRIGA